MTALTSGCGTTGTLQLKFRSEVRYVTELIDALLTVDTLYKQ